MRSHPLIGGILGKAPFYFQIWRDRLRVSSPNGTKAFDDKPIVAIDSSGAKPVVMAFGSEAERSEHRLFRPFSHPRLMVHEFMVAEVLLKHALKQVAGSRLFAPTPIAVMHPMDPPDDGPTDIEERALRELGHSAGARDVYLWYGRSLTNYDLQQGVFRDGA
jgi:rod shape-determining protein MreB and related proteins